MKQVLVVLALALVAGCGLLPDITQSVDVNQNQIVYDAGCGCQRDRDTGLPVGTTAPLGFSCPLDTGGSSCTASWTGGGLFTVHTICEATALTAAVDILSPVTASPLRVDPIQSAGGPHSCTITLELSGLVVAGPIPSPVFSS